ncbi:MAG: hypothetical protein U9Q63_00125 [Patescibacteria group bacterium]|nr:hypothetical protein [Patescibacteria group bacterium]
MMKKKLSPQRSGLKGVPSRTDLNLTVKESPLTSRKGFNLTDLNLRGLNLVIIIGVGLLGLLIVQWLTPNIWGADGYYHIRLAEIFKNSGFIKTLPQARFSYFADRFSNKDWLYHLLLVPFTCFSNIFVGAKWAAFLFGGVFYISLLIIASYYVTSAGLIVVGLAPFLSSHFLQTLSRPRPMILGITLGLWVAHFLIQKKNKKVFGVSLIYSMMHITALIVVGYGIIISFFRWMFKKRANWQGVFWAGAGVLGGFILHPNLPNNFFYFYLNGILVPFFATRWGVLELGAEFFPMTTLDYFKKYPLIVLGLLFMVLVVLMERPKTKKQTQIMFLLSSVFIIMGMLSKRYISHGYPFLILTLGMFISDWQKSRGFKKFLKKIERSINLIMVIGVGLVFWLLFSGFSRTVATARGITIINKHYESMGEWLKIHVPDDELIFHANWSDSQYFIGINPKNDYFVTMDPVYMWHKNEEVYKLYRAIAFGQIKDPYKVLKESFGVNYGYIGKNYFSALIKQVRVDERFEILKEDQFGLIFKLKEEQLD